MSAITFRLILRFSAAFLLSLATTLTTTFAQSREGKEGIEDMEDIVIDEVAKTSMELFSYKDIAIDWKMKPRAQAEFNEGLNNLMEGNTPLAVENFNAAIKEDGGFWEVYYYRGAALKKLEKLNDAKRDFKLLVDSDKERYYSQIELGKIALLQGDLDASDKYFNKAARASDKNAYAYFLKGNNYLVRGLLKLAANAYRNCIERDSTMHDALVALAVLSSKKSLVEGVPYLNKVLRRDSLHVNALLLRGLARAKDNKTLAIRDFSNVIIKDPNSLIGRFLRGVAYSELGDFDRAFIDFHKLVDVTSLEEDNYVGKQTWTDKKIDIQNLGAYTLSRVYGLLESDATVLKKAFCLIVSNKHEKAAQLIDGLSIANTEPLCVYLKAISMEHSGKHHQAFELYCKALVLDKDIVDAYKKRGIYYQEMNLYDKSIADFTTVLKFRPRTLIALKARGVSYINSNRAVLAYADFDQYLKYDSTDMETLYYRGLAGIQQKKMLTGVVDLVKADKWSMVDIDAFTNCVDSLIAHEDTLKIISSLNKITKVAPWFTETQAQKMRLLIAKKRWDVVNVEIDTAIQSRRADASLASYSYLLTVKAMSNNMEKRFEQAIEMSTRAINADKGNSLAYIERGKAYANIGKTGKAVGDMNKAAALGHKEAPLLLANMRVR